MGAAQELERRALGAYLGLAVGDALGATVEFMTPREIAATFGVHDTICGGGWLRLRCGEVTDDTTLSLALGRAILQHGGVEPRAVAESFDSWMRSKPVDIGNTVRRGIVQFRHSGSWVAPASEHDAGNGACMRVLPVALALLGRDEAALRQAVIDQAHITHHNSLSDAGCCCVVSMVQAFLRGATRNEVLHDIVQPFCSDWPPFRFRTKRRENPSGFIVETLQAVFQSLFDTDTFEACLVETVNRGGDADTTGAIAGMLAGACHGIDAIPKRWLDALAPWARDACEQQARQLLGLAMQEPAPPRIPGSG